MPSRKNGYTSNHAQRAKKKITWRLLNKLMRAMIANLAVQACNKYIFMSIVGWEYKSPLANK